MAVKGHITEWYAAQGYGYVTPEQDARRIKFYRQDVSRSVDSLRAGRPVRFRIVEDAQGNSRALQLDSLRPCPWLTLLSVWFLAALGGGILFWSYPLQVGLFYLILTSLLWLVCVLEWRAERHNKPVTGDAAMLFLCGIGGWPGALTGAYLFRLQARSLVYSTLLFIVIVIHIALVGWSLTPQGMQTLQPIVASVLAHVSLVAREFGWVF